MDNNLFEVYDLLSEHGLQNFFSAFYLQLHICNKDDLLKVHENDLQRIGIVSTLSIKNFEDIVSRLQKNKDYTSPKKTHERLPMFIVDTLLINQEPVIISANNLQYKEALGEGHFGKVYKGLWQRTYNGKNVTVPVAIKTLTDGVEMSWKKEVSIFTALNQNHPSIIKFFGLLVSQQDEVKMVTEFAAYGSLLDRLRSRQITKISILSQFAAQIATGMVFLHSKNLVHRDLSARNILVTATNQVKISDFGLSKVLSETEQEWVMESNEMLPMRWLAPESFNHGVFTTASDVWSFAVVLWEMFTFGNVPWENLDNDQVKEKIEDGACLSEPSVCPAGFYAVMSMCFCVEAETRPPFHVVRDELISKQPETLIAMEDETSRQHLNFKKNEYVTAIKHVKNDQECVNKHNIILFIVVSDDLWLGQHEKTLLFGCFKRSLTTNIPHTIRQNKHLENNTKHMTFEHLPVNGVSEQEYEENCETAPHYQVPRPVTDVKMSPKQPNASTNEPIYHSNHPLSENKVADNILYEKLDHLKQTTKQRPRSDVVLSNRRPIHERTYELESLKSDSDSKLMFKNIKPEIQETVNNRIALNMNAFVSLTEPKDSEQENLTNRISPEGYLLPVDVSLKPSLEAVIKLEDPFPCMKSVSQENIYEEIVTPPLQRKFRSTETIIQRPRPKPRNLNNALDRYADSVKKDLNRFAKTINNPQPLPKQTLPIGVKERQIATRELNGSTSVKNHEYLQKYSHVILPHTLPDNLSNCRKQTDNAHGNSYGETKVVASRLDYAEYFNTPKEEGKQRKDFKYDAEDAKNSPLVALPVTAKERAKRAVTNYTNNDWHLFDDCTKSTKRTDRKSEGRSSLGEEISWPQDMSKLSQSKKEEFSTKFQNIRQTLPDATVSDCLDGLRFSQNNVQHAVKYIQVLKLTRYNFGFSYEQCETLFEEHNEKFDSAEKALKIAHIKEQFKNIDHDQITGLLAISDWNVKRTLTTIFLQSCHDFGVPTNKAENILSECGHDVTKSLEMAKIVRLAEITNKAEQLCFKALTHNGWNIERAVEYIFIHS